MSQSLEILVGDRFEEFGRNPHVKPISEYLGEARRGDASGWVIIGQGLSQQALIDLAAVCPQHVKATGTPQPATSALTHKRAEKNIMVSLPRAKSDTLFEADLFLDERNEIMEDHQTGQHIPGLALIEAARQLWTAVTESFFLSEQSKKRFVIDSINSSFSNFVFPLPCTMNLHVLESTSTSFQRTFSVRVIFYQNGLQTTAIDAHYRVIDERVSVRQEATAARRAVAEIVDPIQEIAV